MLQTCQTDIQLETDRFLLRQMRPGDTPELIRFAEDEPELWDFALVETAGRENMIRYIEDALSDREAEKAYPFVVVEKNTGRIVGSTRFYDVKFNTGSTLIGYTWYSKFQQGTGINAHCKYLLLKHAFETWGLERVEFRADTRNLRSIAAMRKIGCIEEGTLRSHLPVVDGTRRDSVIFSILRSEWDAIVKSKLEQKLFEE